MSSSALETVKGLYAAFARGDVPTVLGALAPGAEWTEAEGFPYAGTYIGADAVLSGVFMRIGADWDGFAAVPEEFITEGETVVSIGRYSGKSKATGKSFVAPFVHVWRIRDGKVVKYTQHADTLLVHRALQP